MIEDFMTSQAHSVSVPGFATFLLLGEISGFNQPFIRKGLLYLAASAILFIVWLGVRYKARSDGQKEQRWGADFKNITKKNSYEIAYLRTKETNMTTYAPEGVTTSPFSDM